MKFEILLTEKLNRAMDESYIANKRLKEKLDAAYETSKQYLLTVTVLQKQIEQVFMQRDDNRALYNYTRYLIIDRTC